VNAVSDQDEGCQAAPLDDAAQRRTAPTSLPRRTRRLSDKVLVAFHQACDTSDLEMAARLLSILETILARRSVEVDRNHRRSIEDLVAAHERMWHLRHPAVDQPYGPDAGRPTLLSRRL